MNQTRQRLLVIGAVALAACLLGAFFNPTQFFRSYLVAYVYWLGLGLGSLAIVMTYHLTGGGWGVAIRRVLEAATRTIPLLAVLFVPLLLGMRRLYPWADAARILGDPVLQHKAGYLNVPFFVGRAAVYFASWLVLARLLNRWSDQQDGTRNPGPTNRLRRLSAGGLVLWGFTVSFAAIDWVMSLEPHWFSTIYGMVFMGSQLLGALAFSVVLIAFQAHRQPMSQVLTPARLNDLGNLLLMAVMLWAYLSFSQLLLIWSGNLPEEIPWYLRRMVGGWQVVAVVLAVFYFAVPFALLLSRQTKRRLKVLAIVAGTIVLVRLCEVFYLVAPGFTDGRLRVHWMDVAAMIGLGGAWLAMFSWQLGRRSLSPVRDAELDALLARPPV
jgi:hypothetical protein